MYPAIILIGILIVLFVKFNSSEVYSILTSEVTSEGDDEHETETTGCLSKLNTLRATLEAKKRELKTLRTARKKECNEQLAKTQAEVDRIQTKIDNFSSKTKIVPLPGGEVGPPYPPRRPNPDQLITTIIFMFILV